MRIVDRGHAMGVAVLRIAVGIIFLWAGLEKFFGAAAPGWTSAGFLKFATAGTLSWPFVSGTPAKDAVFNPTHDIWVSLAGNAQAMSAIDTLVVFGETAIGIALILGPRDPLRLDHGHPDDAVLLRRGLGVRTGIVNQHLTYAVVTPSSATSAPATTSASTRPSRGT